MGTARPHLALPVVTEVVQDTLIAVAKKMPEFKYDPVVDSFKGWLLTVTRWKFTH